jgi:cytochrome b6-f complex iron-sulfur subunit
MQDGPAAVPRRQVLCGLMMLGVSGGLAACGPVSTSTSPRSSASPKPSPTGTASAASLAPSTAASPSSSAAVSGALARVAEIPVGGGKLVSAPDGSAILLVQPTAGRVLGFDPTCTHQGTQVNPPVNNVIECPNHHSRYRATDGSVVNGPAAAPLNGIPVRVVAGQVVLG